MQRQIYSCRFHIFKLKRLFIVYIPNVSLDCVQNDWRVRREYYFDRLASLPPSVKNDGHCPYAAHEGAKMRVWCACRSRACCPSSYVTDLLRLLRCCWAAVSQLLGVVRPDRFTSAHAVLPLLTRGSAHASPRARGHEETGGQTRRPPSPRFEFGAPMHVQLDRRRRPPLPRAFAL